MNKDTTKALKTIIKKLVAEEVSKQIKYVVKELTDPTPAISSSKSKLIEEFGPVNEDTPKYSETKKYTDDPVLNEVLNKTQGGIAQDKPGFEEYPTMGGGAVDSVDKMVGMQSSMAPMETQGNMPDFMKKAMSGHSAKVVKAIEGKHGTRT
tara:strand:+ start:1324 stop:1776 length:453 start_codon:yes stop_codon:yes gene_type:complete